MSLHPPAPEELGELVEAYAQTVRSVIDLARTLRPGDAERPTDCPGWTVADQVAHVVGGEAMAAGEEDADVDVSGLAHVKHAFGARHEKAVQLRRGRPLDEVVEELEERLEERLSFYGAEDATAQTPLEGPFGATTLGASVALRTFDIWVHEQDIREAIGRPGGLDTPAAALSVSR
ncbi:MAG: maleylpyruvate isomerase family mycothiol-dependent enzyme, partial [Ornithinibacter sp.]